MAKHTKEPWRVSKIEDDLVDWGDWTRQSYPDADIKVLGEKPWLKVWVPDGGGFYKTIAFVDDNDQENAKRIVDCVNFCAGFTSEQLAEMRSLKNLIERME